MFGIHILGFPQNYNLYRSTSNTRIILYIIIMINLHGYFQTKISKILDN